MNAFAFLLPLLLYMDFGGHKISDYATEHCIAVQSKSLLRTCNRVCSDAIPQPHEIQQIQDYFGDIPFTWLVQTDDILSNNILQAHGLHHLADFSAMIADITTITAQTYAPEIAIKRVQNAAELQQWLLITAHNYAYDIAELTKAIHNIMNLGLNSVQLYLGTYQGIPTAATMLILHDTIATLHMVSTSPEYRRKGIGYAISHTALHQAHTAGCSRGLLLASTMAEPVYERLGFCEYTMYAIWGN